MLRDVQQLLDQKCAANLEGMVTFTDVEMTADLKYATIYYSVLGSDGAREKTAAYLAGIQRRVQAQLGRLLRIKNIPEITFKFDPSIEQGIRIEKILNNLSSTDDNPENGAV